MNAPAMTTSTWALALALLAATPPAVPADTGPPEAPILRVETGMHTASIRRIDVDAGERFLVTGSDDKTVRVWDLANGEPLGVLRPPIGEGNEGKIFAVAITPDGKLVAAGGWTGYVWDRFISLYIFERTGRLVRRITGLPGAVSHLAFSPDGTRLAATLGGANGLRVFRVANGEELYRDTDPEDSSYWADFDASGRLVTSSDDGQIRLYGLDHRKLATREAPGGEQPFGVVFSPDGQRIAVGYSDSTRVDILSGANLKLQYSADTEGANLSLFSVAWSADGTFLLAAGLYDIGGKNPIRRWPQSGQGKARDLDGPLNTVMGLRALADGRLVFGAQDPAWGVFDASGERIIEHGPAQADLMGLLNGFRIDRGGERIRFAYEQYGRRPAVFSLPDRRLVLDPPSGERFGGQSLYTPRTKAFGLEITGWQSTYEIRRNGDLLILEDNEIPRSLAIAADGQSFLLGM